MKTTHTLVLIVAAFAGLILLTASRDSAPPPEPAPRTIAVTGTAVVHTVPDTVVWHLTTRAEHADLGRAKAASDRELQAVLAAARDLGLAEEDIQTGQLRADREYHRDQWGESTRFRHWNVSRQVTLTQRELDGFDGMLTALVEAADVELHYKLRSSRIHERRADTRLDAGRLARTKAEALGAERGGELGEVLTVDEIAGGGYAYNPLANAAFHDPVSVADASTGTFAPGTIEVRVAVGATFGIL